MFIEPSANSRRVLFLFLLTIRLTLDVIMTYYISPR